MNKGFSLLEVIIYCALYSLLFGGVITSVYQLMHSAYVLQVDADLQSEALFVYQKFEWYGKDMITIASPDLFSTSTSFIIERLKEPFVVECYFEQLVYSILCKEDGSDPEILSNIVSDFSAITTGPLHISFSIGSTTYDQVLYTSL
jgi:hypothetical protein